MNEKTKRKAKPKQPFLSPSFQIAASLLGLSLVLGFAIVSAYFFIPQPRGGWPTGTKNAIETQNAINLTHIAATYTHEAMITATSTPMVTLNGTITIEDVRLTATALDCWCYGRSSTIEPTISIHSVQLTATHLQHLWPSATPK